MSLGCPECGATLKTFNIKPHFTCPSCKAELRGKVIGPIVAAIIISTIADSIIFPIVYTHYGMDWWPGLTIRIIASGTVFFILMALMINVFGVIEK